MTREQAQEVVEAIATLEGAGVTSWYRTDQVHTLTYRADSVMGEHKPVAAPEPTEPEPKEPEPIGAEGVTRAEAELLFYSTKR